MRSDFAQHFLFAVTIENPLATRYTPPPERSQDVTFGQDSYAPVFNRADIIQPRSGRNGRMIILAQR